MHLVCMNGNSMEDIVAHAFPIFFFDPDPDNIQSQEMVDNVFALLLKHVPCI